MLQKTLLFGGSLAAVELAGIPSAGLLIGLLAVVVLDFITGVLKCVLTKTPITSKGFRGTISKFVQYGFSLMIGISLSYFIEQKAGAELSNIATIANEGLILFIIYTEVASIFENLVEIDPKSPFSQNFIKPVLRLLTIQITRKQKELEAVVGEAEPKPDTA